MLVYTSIIVASIGFGVWQNSTAAAVFMYALLFAADLRLRSTHENK